MKRYIALVLLALPAIAWAGVPNDPVAMVRSADSLYAAGDHRGALDIYTALADAHSSADLAYNIGNCHFKLGDKARAVLWFERAHRLAPGDADINANLDLARAQIVDRVNAVPGMAIGGAWSGFIAGSDVDFWARVSLWIGLGTFGVLALVLLTVGPMRRVLIGLAALLGLATLLSIGLAAYRASAVRDDTEAIIMAPKVDVRSEPRDGGLAVFVLHEGTKVSVQQARDGWCEVKLANGNIGWMKASDLERI